MAILYYFWLIIILLKILALRTYNTLALFLNKMTLITLYKSRFLFQLIQEWFNWYGLRGISVIKRWFKGID